MPIERPICKTCPYWNRIDDYPGHGVCRIKPPRRSVLGTGWPGTEEHEWCGEHPDFHSYLVALSAEKAEAAMAADWNPNPPDEPAPAKFEMTQSDRIKGLFVSADDSIPDPDEHWPSPRKEES
jgi:hypothetical protein